MTPSIAFAFDTGNEPLNTWNFLDLVECLRGLGVDATAVDLNYDVPNADVNIFYRTNRCNYSTLVKALKGMGKWVGYSIDDLIWDPVFRYAYDPFLQNNIRLMIEEAQFLVLPSEFLAQRLLKDFACHGKPVIFRKPAILEQRFYEARKTRDSIEIHPRRPFRILLSKGHVIPEVKTMSLEILEKAAPQVDEEVDVFYYSFGMDQYPSHLGPFTFHKSLFYPFDEYFLELAKMAPDLIVVPLPFDDFHHCKSYPKYLEAGAIRADILASPVYPHQRVMHPSQIGRDIDDFAAKLVERIQSKNRIRGDCLSEDVEKNHLLTPIAEAFLKQVSTFCVDNN